MNREGERVYTVRRCQLSPHLLQGMGVEEQHPHCHGCVHVPPPHRRPPRNRPAPGPAAEGGGLLHVAASGTGEDKDSGQMNLRWTSMYIF